MRWYKTGFHFACQRLAEQGLDCREQADFIGTDQRNCCTWQPGTSGAADPVDVVLGDLRQIDIDNAREFADVEPA